MNESVSSMSSGNETNDLLPAFGSNMSGGALEDKSYVSESSVDEVKNDTSSLDTCGSNDGFKNEQGKQKKKPTATGKGTRKKRGTYNNYKDEAGQQKVKNAIETFFERRRMNNNASLRAFAMEVDIKYETLKPYCRVDESKRKKFVIKGQRRLVPEVDMDSFCRRMIREQPTLDRANIINAFLAQFSHLKLDRKAACNQYDRMIKKKCESISQEVDGLAALPDTHVYESKRKTSVIKGKAMKEDGAKPSVDSGTGNDITTTVGKKRGYDKVINKGAKATRSDADKKRGKYMSFSHRLQLQREAEKQFAKFVRFLLSHLKICDMDMYHKAEWALQSCYAMKNDLSTTEALLRVTVGETHWVGAFGCFEDNQCLKQVQYADLSRELDEDDDGKASFLHFVNAMQNCS